MHECLGWSATEMARRIRAREVSSAEVVDAHIDRIAAVNPQLNAVVAERFEDARAEARAADARPSTTPLAGVPCTIKEFVAVRGMPHTGGIGIRRGVRATDDAPIVTRLRAAGAIVLGVTNAPEGGLWAETNNPVYGRTNNPHDLRRTSGGSSGGEGAIIAAGGSPFGIGSDTGGSIRIPSAFCGIAGHKPTGGMLPNTGHFPHAPALPIPIMTCGPMARRVEDLWPLLRITAGPDGVDPWVTEAPSMLDPAGVDLRDLTVFTAPVGRPEMVAAVARSADALVAAGARRGALPRAFTPYEGLDTWAAVLHASGIAYDEIVAERRVPLLWESLRWLAGRSHHAGGVLMILALQRYVPVGRKDGLRAAAMLTQALEDALGPNGVLLYPTFPRAAPRHRGMAVGNPFDTGCTALFNVTTSPVTVVRVGEDPAGMPIGLQVVGRRGADHLTLAAAAALERAFGGWTGPVTPHRGMGRLAELGRRVRA